MTQETIALVAKLQGELLRECGSGHPEWYAEMLFAAAFSGQLMPTNYPGFDMRTERWGTVQVKCRVDGTDSTQNRANFRGYSVGEFDHVCIVLFERTFRIKGAVVLPCAEVLSLVRPAGHVKWVDAMAHAGAIDVTSDLRAVSGE